MPLRPRSLLVAALVGVVAAVPLAAGAAAAPGRHASAQQVASVPRYVSDAKSATGALSDFGSDLQTLDSLSAFQAKLRTLRGELRTFDTSIRRMRAYRLSNATLDGQRARLARTGPPLAVTLSQFLDAVRDNDSSAVRGLLPKVNAGLKRFVKAAQIGG